MTLKDEINRIVSEYYSCASKLQRQSYKNQISKLVSQSLNKSLPYIAGYYNMKVFRSYLCFEKEDVVQECLIILLKSIEKFDIKRNQNFYGFYYSNVMRKIYQLYDVSKRKRRAISVSITSKTNEDVDPSIFSSINFVDLSKEIEKLDEKIEPLELIQRSYHQIMVNDKNSLTDEIDKEYKKEFIISRCSERERSIVKEILENNKSITEIAKEINISKAAVSQAVKRITNRVKSLTYF